MKTEIKEILEYIQKYTDEYETTNLTEIRALQIGYVDTVLLLDYITNLQEENERLKEIVENLTTMTASGDGKQIKNTAQFKLDICKQRIDKAIELINKHSNYPTYYLTGNIVKDLLKILQGKSDE